MDGFEMVAELQKHEDWRKIPVVVVSAKELTQDERLRLQAGEKRFSRKVLLGGRN